MANPRKFSEKIALHNQKQAEETAAFERIMREVSDATSKVCIATIFGANAFSRFWFHIFCFFVHYFPSFGFITITLNKYTTLQLINTSILVQFCNVLGKKDIR